MKIREIDDVITLAGLAFRNAPLSLEPRFSRVRGSPPTRALPDRLTPVIPLCGITLWVVESYETL